MDHIAEHIMVNDFQEFAQHIISEMIVKKKTEKQLKTVDVFFAPYIHDSQATVSWQHL